MTVKFLFLAFCLSRTLSQPHFPQESILAGWMLKEPGMWTVWAAAKSPSICSLSHALFSLSHCPCLCFRDGFRVLSIDPGVGLLCAVMALFIWTVTVINSIISYALHHMKSTLKTMEKKIWLALKYIKLFQRLFQNTLREAGLMWLPYSIALWWSFPWWVIRFQICCLICKCLAPSDGSCYRHWNY